ncbi:MAG: hypothetical protein JWQ50_7025 [Caballeronia mineralivorans]|jgi:hypothetical protein|nr:hypothetical protein [Caballeronia mineralivorans]MEA3102927.1 hypothetical protein [Caballeronia mineralivorans]
MTPATIRRIAPQWASVLTTTIDTELILATGNTTEPLTGLRNAFLRGSLGPSQMRGANRKGGTSAVAFQRTHASR